MCLPHGQPYLLKGPFEQRPEVGKGLDIRCVGKPIPGGENSYQRMPREENV